MGLASFNFIDLVILLLQGSFSIAFLKMDLLG